MREAAHQLDVCFTAIADAPDEFSFVEQTEWSTKWQRELVSSAGRLLSSLEVVERDVETLLKSAGLDLSVTDCDSLSRLLDLSKAILDCSGKSLQFCFDGNYREKLDAADSFLLLLERYKELESRLSVPYREEAVRGLDPQGLQQKWEEAKTKFWLIRIISMRKLRKGLAEEGGCSSPPNVDSDLPLLFVLKARLQELDQLSPHLEGIPGYSFLSSNAEEMSNVCEIARQLQKTITTIATDPETLTELRDKVRGLVVGANDLLDPELQIATAFAVCGKSFEELLERMGETEAGCASSDYRARPFQDLRRVCETIRNEETRLRAWCQWYGARNEALRQGLAPLVDAVEQGALEKGDAEEAFTTGYSRWFAEQKIDNDPVLREFSSVKQEDAIKRFQRVDDEVAALSSQYIRASLGGELPSKESVGKKDGYGILKHELQKKRAHKPLRQLASEMGEAFSQLAPCMLMSPLSIAQYLPADQQLFDLVIFDEASQITPWDAVGAMARGKQVVIAGDPRQMPPTNFFMKGARGGGFDGSDEEDLESILDECLAVGVPRLSLNWHYRSRHESLIAFSNYRYYGGKLVTFPAAEVRESAVSRRQVDGIYAKERARINEDEAKAIVAEVVSRLKDPAFNRENLTLGVIVLNADQQELIEDLLDVARRENREIEPHFDEQLSEPVVVKNLETVQGDERDVILLGIGYGPKEPGADVMSMDFGPLNREGGERRLNVALTRSRREMIIFTSFPPSMIDLNRTGARAVRDLRDVLDYADRGPKALAQSVKGSMGGYDSDFEESVDTRIKDKGWQTVTQVGVSRFRVDLGVVHPKRPGDFLAGVECDGATYHSSATARDRDKVRASVLEGLGWNLVRVWSTDWFCDPESEIEKIDRQLNKLLREDEEREEKRRKDEYRDQPDEPLRPSVAEGEGESDSSSKAITSSAELPLPVAASGKIKIKGRPKKESYAVVDFSQLDIVISPDSFHEGSYTKVLTEMIGHTLEVEAPIEEGLLVTRIARAHGLKRSGRRIRERVFDILDQSPFVVREDPGEGTFVWKEDPDGYSLDVIRKPRKSDGEEAFRLFDQIPAEEIVAARQLVKGREPAKEIATLFGIKRLTSTGKERIDVALSCIEGANSE